MNIENDIFKAVTELKVIGDLYVDGKQVKGVKTTTWGTYCLIETDVLEKLLAMQSRCSALDKSMSHVMSLVQSNKIAQHSDDSKELQRLRDEVTSLHVNLKAMEDLNTKLSEARSEIESLKNKFRERKETEGSKNGSVIQPWEASMRVRTAKKDRTFALILSMSLHNKSTYSISEELKSQGLGNSGTHIARALSVLKDGDKARLRGIISSHPEMFEGVSDEDFEAWFADRYKRLKKASDLRAKKEPDKKAAQADEWGEPISVSEVPARKFEGSENCQSISQPPRGTSASRSKIKPRLNAEFAKNNKAEEASEQVAEPVKEVPSEPVQKSVQADIRLGEMPAGFR